MVVFSRISAEIDPAFMETVPGLTVVEKLSFLQNRLLDSTIKTESNVSFKLNELDSVILLCNLSHDIVLVEEILEGIDHGEKKSPKKSPRKAASRKAATRINKRTAPSGGESTKPAPDMVQSQSSMETTDDGSCNVDEDTDMYEFTDETETTSTPAKKSKSSAARQNKAGAGQGKKSTNVRYIEYRKITADEYTEEDGKMQCKKCDYYAPSRKRIIEHIRRKHDVPQFECQHCDKKFKTRSDYNKHQKSHPEAETNTQFLVKNRRPDLCCKKCNKTFASLREWADHRETVHKIPTDISQYENNAKRGYKEGNGKYYCNQCIFETDKKRYMTAHIHRQHDSVYCCPFCEKKFSMKGTCASHIHVHNFCEFCGRLSKTKAELKSHKDTEHPPTDAGGGDAPERKSFLWGMMRLYYETDDQFMCAWCKEVANSAGEVQAHIVAAHQSEPHICVICKENLASLGELNEHLQSHLRCEESVAPAVKAYSCHRCGKAYNSRTTLRIHLDQVHDRTIDEFSSSDSQEQQQQQQQPPPAESSDPASAIQQHLKCPHCPYVGHLTKYLNEHILRRHGEKKYQCPYCPKKFSTKSVFNVHKQRHSRSGRFTSKSNDEVKKETIYYCPVCSKEFTTKLTLQKHLEQTHPEFDIEGSEFMNELKDSDIYSCKLCLKAYCSVSQLRQHFTRDHKEEDCTEFEDFGTQLKELRCGQCDYTSASIRNYNDHIVRRHGEKKFECAQCPKKFTTKSSYNTHMRNHKTSIESIYNCPLCSKIYQFESSFKNHLRQSHPDYEYAQDAGSTEEMPIHAVCPVCKMAYRYQSSYLAHLERMHPDHSQETIDEGYQLAKDETVQMDTVENSAMISLDQAIQDLVMDPPLDPDADPSGDPVSGMLSCQICDYTTHNPRYMNEHLKLKHGERKFVCPVCARDYPSQGQLTMHCKTHTDKYFCDQCGKLLSSASALKTHVRMVHDGIKRKRPEERACPYCGQKLREAYEAHVNKHLGILPYQCQTCGKAFPGKLNLKIHNRTHEDKKYPCEICGTELSSASHLSRHKKTHKNVFDEAQPAE